MKSHQARDNMITVTQVIKNQDIRLYQCMYVYVYKNVNVVSCGVRMNAISDRWCLLNQLVKKIPFDNG